MALGEAAAGRDSALRSWMDGSSLADALPATLRTLEGWCALGARDLETAAAAATSVVRSVGSEDSPEARPLACWIAARAFEAAGERDSAIAYCERVASSSGLWSNELDRELLLRNAGRCELIRLALEANRIQMAKGQLGALMRDCRDADPQVRGFVERLAARVQAAG